MANKIDTKSVATVHDVAGRLPEGLRVEIAKTDSSYTITLTHPDGQTETLRAKDVKQAKAFLADIRDGKIDGTYPGQDLEVMVGGKAVNLASADLGALHFDELADNFSIHEDKLKLKGGAKRTGVSLDVTTTKKGASVANDPVLEAMTAAQGVQMLLEGGKLDGNFDKRLLVLAMKKPELAGEAFAQLLDMKGKMHPQFVLSPAQIRSHVLSLAQTWAEKKVALPESFKQAVAAQAQLIADNNPGAFTKLAVLYPAMQDGASGVSARRQVKILSQDAGYTDNINAAEMAATDPKRFAEAASKAPSLITKLSVAELDALVTSKKTDRAQANELIAAIGSLDVEARLPYLAGAAKLIDAQGNKWVKNEQGENVKVPDGSTRVAWVRELVRDMPEAGPIALALSQGKAPDIRPLQQMFADQRDIAALAQLNAARQAKVDALRSAMREPTVDLTPLLPKTTKKPSGTQFTFGKTTISTLDATKNLDAVAPANLNVTYLQAMLLSAGFSVQDKKVEADGIVGPVTSKSLQALAHILNGDFEPKDPSAQYYQLAAIGMAARAVTKELAAAAKDGKTQVPSFENLVYLAFSTQGDLSVGDPKDIKTWKLGDKPMMQAMMDLALSQVQFAK